MTKRTHRDDLSRARTLTTQRQRQVAELACLGLTDKEIAAELNISYRTVRTHVEALYARFGVNTRAGLVGRWLRPEHDDSDQATP